MKKLLCIILALGQLGALAACGGGGESAAPSEAPATQAETPAAQTAAPDAPAPAEETADYSWWDGGWYGWWSIKNATGVYEPANKIAWDAYADVDVHKDNTVSVAIWDTGTTRDDPLLYAYGGFEPGATERGKLVAERVNFFPDGVWNNGAAAAETDIRPGWTVEPAESTVSRFENMIELTGRYESPDNAADAFDYFIYLRPWGMEWEDVRNGDTTGCIYKDMMPLYYDNWYISLLRLGYQRPVGSFNEGIDVINAAINSASGASGSSGALDPAAKEGADGRVDLATLQRVLPWAKKAGYSATYDEVAAEFGAHGRAEESPFEGKSIYRWWATDDDYIEITFDIHEDGSETWNITQWRGVN